MLNNSNYFFFGFLHKESQECVEGTNNKIIQSYEEKYQSKSVVGDDGTHPELLIKEEEKVDNKPKIIENVKFSFFAESLFTGFVVSFIKL